jgi:flagellar hook protein FlgE
MSVIGNNIANVNTIGFKAGRVNFQDQLSQLARPASAPTSGGVGGRNAIQIGLGVEVGAVSTLQTQGNLQTTGKSSDFSIQGVGFFMVTGGQDVQFTRDGSFDLDVSGNLVNSATGQKLLGYLADANGNIDTTIPVSNESTLSVPVGTLLDAKQTTAASFVGNLDAGAALYSTKVDWSGNLSTAALATDTVETTSTVFDALGNAHAVKTTFSNPTAAVGGTPPAPAGATQAWDVTINVDGANLYESTAGKSRAYNVGGTFVFADTATGASLGSSIVMDGTTGSNAGQIIPGSSGAPNFAVTLNYGTLTNTSSTSSLAAVSDGQAGSPPQWGTAVEVFDTLGVSHLVKFKYNRVQMDGNQPAGATAQWNWSATENGNPVGGSTTAGNSPLYFNSSGRLVGGGAQEISVSPTNGSTTPFTITLDNSRMGQLASDSSIASDSQNGYATGSLQGFSVGGDGVITGVFSSGQSRRLGQLAVANFSNAGGLEKIGNNTFRETPNSGTAQVGVPNQSGRGKISPGYLEMSNVDLANEFTQLIITERGFQANTRIITAVDNLLQDVINLKR